MERDMKNRWIALYVENQVGVLAKVSGLFPGKSYNLQSLTVGTTEDETISRMTICVTSDDITFEQIKKQLAKLVDVRDIKELKPDESVRRELMLVKIRVNENERRNVIAISDVFRGRIVDVGQESLIVELTGNQSKLEGFLNLVQGYEILELARTGVTGLSRGVHDVRYLD